MDLKDEKMPFLSPVNQLSCYPGRLLMTCLETSDVHAYLGFVLCFFFPSPTTYWIEIEVFQENWLVCFFLGRRGRELIPDRVDIHTCYWGRVMARNGLVFKYSDILIYQLERAHLIQNTFLSSVEAQSKK